LCECEKQARNKKAAERKKLKDRMDKVLAMVEELLEKNCFSLNQLKSLFQGKSEEEIPNSIYKIWEDYIDTKRQLGKVGSARTGKDIYKRFVKYMGNNVSFEDINHHFLLKWIALMKKDGLSSTSCAISLRTFRTIVNICITEGFVIGNTKDMFKDTDYNKSGSRKHEFLDVDAMRALYKFWEKEDIADEDGKQLFYPKRKYAIFRDLGLFLFMYLGDGQNLADTLRLTYDEWYFATHGKQMRFYRNKTKDRNENASEVIFPVTEEMQKILNKYANEPKPGARVFPIMKEFITPEQEFQVIQRYNKYIRKHMAIVSDLMGMEQRPSSTWARHSFATNLNNSGKVPYKYISDSMGHSSSGDITSNYIGAYPLKKMLEFNWYLLHDASESTNPHADKQELISILKSMSEEERRELLASI
jgi:site-specific recombinase XerD